MRPVLEIKRIDRGMAKIRRTMKAAKDTHVKAGLLGNGKPRADGLSNAEVGIINEFGTSTQPARPFIHPAFTKHRAEYVAMLKKFTGQVLKGTITFDRALEIIGLRMAADMKNFVTQGDQVPPPNAPSTIQRKLRTSVFGRTRIGPPVSPRTLVDTAGMVNSITHQVVKK